MPSKLSFVSLSIGALLILSVISVIATITTSAYALRFDTDTGTGFITKGELQKALGMNNVQLQQGYQNIFLQLSAEMYWNVICTDGEIIEHTGGEQLFGLHHQPVINPQGKLIAIELTGYREHPDAFNKAIRDGPGSVCTFANVESWTLDEIGDLSIVGNGKYIPIH